ISGSRSRFGTTTGSQYFSNRARYALARLRDLTSDWSSASRDNCNSVLTTLRRESSSSEKFAEPSDEIREGRIPMVLKSRGTGPGLAQGHDTIDAGFP